VFVTAVPLKWFVHGCLSDLFAEYILWGEALVFLISNVVVELLQNGQFKNLEQVSSEYKVCERVSTALCCNSRFLDTRHFT
jgi:hypothetical protein